MARPGLSLSAKNANSSAAAAASKLFFNSLRLEDVDIFLQGVAAGEQAGGS